MMINPTNKIDSSKDLQQVREWHMYYVEEKVEPAGSGYNIISTIFYQPCRYPFHPERLFIQLFAKVPLQCRSYRKFSSRSPP
jgi:hypothetical protein